MTLSIVNPTDQVLVSEIPGYIRDLARAYNAIASPENYYYNVKTYGAVGDGVNDDTSAIQSAIDAAESVGGGTIFLPDGTYKITSTLTITSDDVGIQSNSGKSILAFTSALGAAPGILVQASGTSLIYRNRFSGFGITLVHNSSIGIKLVNPNYFHIDQIGITGANSGALNAQTAIYLDGTTNWGGLGSITRSVTYYTKIGIYVGAVIAATQIQNNLINGLTGAPTGSIGIHIVATTNSGTYISGNDFEGWALAIEDSGLYTQVIANRFEFNTADVTHVYPAADGFYNVGNEYIPVGQCTYTKSSGVFQNYGTPMTIGWQDGVPKFALAANDGSHLELYAIIGSASPILNLKAQYGGTGLFGESLTAAAGSGISSPYQLNIGTSAASDLSLKTDNTDRIKMTSDGKLGFYAVTPVARQLLATGTGKTVDDIITALQALGFFKQS
jgi:hypothetical protein